MVVALTCQVSCPALVRIKVILAGHKKELYSLALPLFMPSMKFMQTIKPLGPDRSSLSAYYCKKPDKDINPHP